jgi:hypothetical protein
MFRAASFVPKRNILRPRLQVALLPLSRLRLLPLLNSHRLDLIISVLVATGMSDTWRWVLPLSLPHARRAQARAALDDEHPGVLDRPRAPSRSRRALPTTGVCIGWPECTTCPDEDGLHRRMRDRKPRGGFGQASRQPTLLAASIGQGNGVATCHAASVTVPR